MQFSTTAVGYLPEQPKLGESVDARPCGLHRLIKVCGGAIVASIDTTNPVFHAYENVFEMT